MNRAALIILCLGLIFFFAEDMSGAADMKKPKLSSQMPTPPELSATVVFAQVVSFKNSSGTQCYSPRPVFTITNTGQSTASNFDYVIDWKLNPTHTWQLFSGGQNLSLGPGSIKSIDGNNPVWDQPWCVDQTDWKPGWRIRVDTNNTVTESNEGNNIAEKIFTPLTIPDMKVPRAIQKDIRKIPSPR